MTSSDRLVATAIALFCLTAPGLALAQTHEPQLTVQVQGLRSDGGKVLLALFNSKSGFPKMRGAVRSVSTVIRRGKASAAFRGLPPGTYAVMVCHDENGNGKLDTSWLGSPQEGVGASNDARGRRGPPKFEDASFKQGSSPQKIAIRMHY